MLASGKPLAIVAYLTLARGRTAAREALVDLLWSDVEPERARASLRQALTAIRGRLGPECVRTEGEWVTLVTGLACDASIFESALADSRFQEAVSSYAGAFIPFFAAPGARAFEHWADIERRRLNAGYLAALRSLVQSAIENGQSMEALTLSERLRDADPDADQHWRLRFRALALAGRFTSMELEETALRSRRREDATEIEPETESLLKRLKRASSGPAGAFDPQQQNQRGVPAEPEFQGRSDVFARLLAAERSAARGRSSAIVLVAPAGQGKTRLLSEFAARLTSHRVQIVRSTARQGERDDPYAVLSEVVTHLSRLPGAMGIAPSSAAVLAGLVPQLSEAFRVAGETVPSDASEVLRRRTLAFTDLLDAITHESPLVLMIDDGQWADASSLTAIERALSRITRSPCLMVIASRSTVSGFAAIGEIVTLEPFSLAEVGALLDSIANTNESWAESHTARIHAVTSGSPLAVLHLLRLSIEQGIIRITDGRWEMIDEPAFERLATASQTIAARIAALSQEELRTLVCMSLVEQPLTEDVLGRACECSADAIRATLFRLETSAFVVRLEGQRWSVAHTLVAEGAREAVPDDRKRGYAVVLARELEPRFANMQDLRRGVRLLLDGGATEEAVGMAERWLASNPDLASTEGAFGSSLVGERYGRDVQERFTVLARRRHRWRAVRRLWPLALAVALVAVVVIAVLRPVELVNVSTLDPTQAEDPEQTYEIPPRVEVRNILGGVTRWRDGDSMEIVPASGVGALGGRTRVRVREGMAEFDSVIPAVRLGDRAPRAVHDVTFLMQGLPPLVLRRRTRVDELAIVDGVVNGQTVDAEHQTVRVGTGEPIRGYVRLRYSTRVRGALYVLAQTTTWGAPERDTLTVRSLLAGVTDAQYVQRLSVPGPKSRGSHWLLWTQGAEPAAQWLLSGTNWTCRTPRWKQGGVLAAQDDSTLAQAVRLRSVRLYFTYCNPREELKLRDLPLAGLRVQAQ